MSLGFSKSERKAPVVDRNRENLPSVVLRREFGSKSFEIYLSRAMWAQIDHFLGYGGLTKYTKVWIIMWILNYNYPVSSYFWNYKEKEWHAFNQ